MVQQKGDEESTKDKEDAKKKQEEEGGNQGRNETGNGLDRNQEQ